MESHWSYFLFFLCLGTSPNQSFKTEIDFAHQKAFRLLLEEVCVIIQGSSFICSSFRSRDFYVWKTEIKLRTHNDFSDVCRSLKLHKKPSTQNIGKQICHTYYRTIYNTLCKSFKSIILMYASGKIFDIAFLYATHYFFLMSWGQWWCRKCKGIFWQTITHFIFFSIYLDDINGQLLAFFLNKTIWTKVYHHLSKVVVQVQNTLS